MTNEKKEDETIALTRDQIGQKKPKIMFKK
jgi:hypothetical protein